MGIFRQREEFTDVIAIGKESEPANAAVVLEEKWPFMAEMEHRQVIRSLHGLGYTILGKKAEQRAEQAEAVLHLDAIGWRSIVSVVSLLPTNAHLASFEFAWWRNQGAPKAFLSDERDREMQRGTANWRWSSNLELLREHVDVSFNGFFDPGTSLVYPNGFNINGNGFWGHRFNIPAGHTNNDHISVFEVTNMAQVPLYGSQFDR